MKSIITLTAAIALSALFSSCASTGAKKTGFLSDYSKLSKESSNSLRYIDEPALKAYSAYMVDPVRARLGSAEQDLTTKQIDELRNYTHGKMVAAVRASGKKVAYQPGPGVARLRVALTEIKSSSALNALPQAAILGVGSGGVSMEAEIIDSITSEQVGAVVEGGSGSRIPFANLGDLGASKGVINGWADRLQKRLSK